jgi:hypothetical protein
MAITNDSANRTEKNLFIPITSFRETNGNKYFQFCQVLYFFLFLYFFIAYAYNVEEIVEFAGKKYADSQKSAEAVAEAVIEAVVEAVIEALIQLPQEAPYGKNPILAGLAVRSARGRNPGS